MSQRQSPFDAEDNACRRTFDANMPSSQGNGYCGQTNNTFSLAVYTEMNSRMLALAKLEERLMNDLIATRMEQAQLSNTVYQPPILAQKHLSSVPPTLATFMQRKGNSAFGSPRVTANENPQMQESYLTNLNVKYIEKIKKEMAESKATTEIPAFSISSCASRSQNAVIDEEGNRFIDYIRPEDVLCGRGGRTNHHPGNIRYREAIREMKVTYMNSDVKTFKTDLSWAIVDHCYSYGARFVKMNEQTGRYYTLSRSEARKKTSQALRELKGFKAMVKKQEQNCRPMY